MINQNQYVPILKGKEGEFRALSKLPEEIKDSIVPIIDLVPNSQKKFDDHIKSTLGYIKKWQRNRLLYIDGYMIQDDENMSSGQHYMSYVFNELRKESFNVIPVVSNVTGILYNEHIKRIVKKDKKGVCVRIFKKATNDLNDELDKLLSYLELESSAVDLVIDLRSLEDISLNEIYDWSVKAISELNYLPNWRSLVISGGNFPIDLTELKQDQIHLIARKEWGVWNKLIKSNDVERLPSYSDYAISHPRISADISGVPNASASIRYTHESDFYVYRGKGTRQYGFEQFLILSQTLINSSEYYGEVHCAGDKFIHICGTEKKKKGNLTTWRWVGTNHHITVVVNQLRQFLRDFKDSRTS